METGDPGFRRFCWFFVGGEEMEKKRTTPALSDPELRLIYRFVHSLRTGVRMVF